MKGLKFWLAAAMVAMPILPVTAAPTVPAAQQEAVTALIPFDPPLDATLRYRWEKSIQKDGKTDLNWIVYDCRFEKSGDGYRLTVNPVSSGSNETDPAKIAMMKRIEELTRRPFILRLDGEGVIKEVEDA